MSDHGDDRGHDEPHAASRAAGAPARRRLAGSRGDVGQDHAPLDGQGDRPEAGRPRAATWAAARCRTTTASRSRAAFPATCCSPSTATSFSLDGTGAGLARHGRLGGRAHRAGATIPPPPPSRAAVTAGRPAAAAAHHRAGAPARPRRRRQHALPGARAGRASASSCAASASSATGTTEIAAGLRELAGHDLVITSGGLGPTHDDRTVEAVAEVAGAELVLDEELLATIAAITAAFARRRGTDPALNRDGDRKQALVPRGATVIPPAGTAPGLLLALGAGHVARAARARRASWRRSGGARSSSSRSRRLRERAGTLLRHTLRVYGVGRAGRGAGLRGRRRRRRRHAHDDLRARAGGGGHDPRGARARGRRSTPSSPACASSSARRSTPRTSGRWPSTCSRSCAQRGLRLAVAESCTAGLVAAQAGRHPRLLGRPARRRDRVRRRRQARAAGRARRRSSPSTARSRPRSRGPWPQGARAATGAEVGIAVTGVAGPGGGSERKPVGLVYLHVSAPGAERGQEQHLLGDRAQVREWATVAALQLVRTTLS